MHVLPSCSYAARSAPAGMLTRVTSRSLLAHCIWQVLQSSGALTLSFAQLRHSMSQSHTGFSPFHISQPWQSGPHPVVVQVYSSSGMNSMGAMGPGPSSPFP